MLAQPEYQAARTQGRIVESDLELNDDQESKVFAAANAVWLGYVGHLVMSSILVQAGLSSLPVVACREGLLGWLTCKEGLGETVDVGNSAEIQAALCA